MATGNILIETLFVVQLKASVVLDYRVWESTSPKMDKTMFYN